MQKYYKYTFKLNASHCMPQSDPHSHTFSIVLFIKDNSDSFSKYNLVEDRITNYFNKFTNKILNDTPDFKNIVPTIENMATKFFEELSNIINKFESYELIKLELSDNILKKFMVSNKIAIGNCMNII